MSENKRRILWVDPAIEMLQHHIFDLEQKGYDVVPAVSGQDGLSLFSNEHFDAILLEQIIPDMDGLTMLSKIKNLNPTLPVIMVTRSEDKSVLMGAISKQADDFLIKPISSGQIAITVEFILSKRVM